MWIRDNGSKKTMALSPRRSGRTTTVALEAVRHANDGKSVLVVSLHKAGTEIVFEMIKMSIYYGTVKRDVTSPLHTIQLLNGGKIVGINQNHLAMKGQQPDVVLVDNFDAMDETFLYGCILPLLQTDLELEIRLVGTSQEFVVDSDEKLFDSKMRWPRSLFHKPTIELIRNIIKDETWDVWIWPEVEGKPELGKCGFGACRGVSKKVNNSYCPECQKKIDEYYAQKEKK